MTVFNPKECAKKPRADMYLPDWLNGLGVFLDVAAAALLVAAIWTGEWLLILGTLICAAIGVAAHLCWKNQRIVVLSESCFEYTTFLGKTTCYYFSDIKSIKDNPDSFTVFVGDGKVHIESIAVISTELLERLAMALEGKPGGPDKNNL